MMILKNRYIQAALVLCPAVLLACCVDDDPVRPAVTKMTWEQVDHPTYYPIRCIALDPDGRILVGTGISQLLGRKKSNVYISSDNGESWRKKELGEFYLRSIASDGEGRLFARGEDCEMLRSLDNGESWEELPTDSLYSCHDALVFDASDRIYLPTYQRGIYRSIDHGESWVRICDEIAPESNLNALAVTSVDCLLANTNTGFYRSCDGGYTWEKRGDGPWGTYSIRMALDSTDRIFARSYPCLYTSNDDGETWQTLDPPGNVEKIFLDIQDRLITICDDSLYLSADGGETWRCLFGFPEHSYHNYPGANAAGDIFVAGRWGVSRSIDDGESWGMLGLSAYSPSDIALGGSGHLYILLRYGGMYRSTGDLDGWTMFSTGLPHVELHCMATARDSTMYVGTDDGVYASLLDDPCWSRAGCAGNAVAGLFTLGGDSMAAATEDNGLFLSIDGGTEWRNLGMVGYHIRSVIKTGDGRLLAGADVGGAFRYTGDGVLWDQVNDGLTDLRVTALAAISSGDLLAGTRGGLFISSDGGASWRRFNDGNINVNTICVAEEHILIGVMRGQGILWTRTGITEMYPLNGETIRDDIFVIRTDPEGFVFALAHSAIFRSIPSVYDISPGVLRLGGGVTPAAAAVTSGYDTNRALRRRAAKPARRRRRIHEGRKR